MVKELTFENLTSKAKVSFDNDKMDVNGKAVIRIKKDETIWLSVMATALNLEVARCLITTDSIKVIDNFNKKYYRYDFATLSAKTGLTLNFGLIQSVLLGNLTKLPGTKPSLSSQDGHQVLTLSNPLVKVENHVSMANLKTDQVSVSQEGTPNRLIINYQDFGDLNGQLFPFTTAILAVMSDDGKLKETKVRLEHQRVELNGDALSFPFNVPDKYEGN